MGNVIERSVQFEGSKLHPGRPGPIRFDRKLFYSRSG